MFHPKTCVSMCFCAHWKTVSPKRLQHLSSLWLPRILIMCFIMPMESASTCPRSSGVRHPRHPQTLSTHIHTYVYTGHIRVSVCMFDCARLHTPCHCIIDAGPRHDIWHMYEILQHFIVIGTRAASRYIAHYHYSTFTCLPVQVTKHFPLRPTCAGKSCK